MYMYFSLILRIPKSVIVAEHFYLSSIGQSLEFVNIYILLLGNHKKFIMEDHGELRLVEEIDTDKEHNLWTIEVEVRDKGMPRLDTFVQVNVFVEDVDDYKPIWHPANNGSYQACKL